MKIIEPPMLWVVSETTRLEEEKGRPAEAVQVKCSGFRCLAYRDEDGRWRDYWKRTPLPEPVEVLHFDD